MSFQGYSGLLKRRRNGQTLVQRCRRLSLRQRVRRCAVLVLMAVKCTRSERRPATGGCRMGRLNLLLLLVRNRWIREENERLRKQASLLSEENRLLRLKLQHVRSRSGDIVQS